MKRIFKPVLLAATFATVTLGTGCGGGSGNGGSGSGMITQETAAQLAITMMSFKDFSATVTAGKSVSQKAGTGNTKAGCSVSGSYTTSYDSASGTSTWTLTDCDDGLGPVNGTSSTTVSGSQISTSSDISFSFGTASISMSFNAQTDSNTGAYSFDMDMIFATPEGTLSIITNPEFAGVDPYPPGSGSMLITGPQGGKIQINAYPNYMEVKADATGDGYYEFTTTVDWANAGF